MKITTNNMWRRLHFILVVTSIILPISLAGRHNKHGGGNRLMELLTAGIVAKVLQKDDSHGGGGGGGGYYTVPVPLPMGSQKSHTHVTEKIIPIPVPHHTTRIIHINAGSEHGSSGGGGFDHGGGGYDHTSGGYGDMSGGGYGDSHDISADIGGGDHHHDDSRHNRSPSIQQLLFHDGGVYGNPHRPAHPHTAAAVMRRPSIGLPTHPIPGIGMMLPPQTAVSAAHLHPVISTTHMYPPMSSAYRYPAMPPISPLYPAMSGSHPHMVRVRHYYPLASNRHKVLAYPSMQQPLYHPQMMMPQNRYPRLW